MEYFRLMLPPWDAKGLCNEWEKMAVRLLGPQRKNALPRTHSGAETALPVRSVA